MIFEESCRTGEVPEAWRKASITIAFKKGKEQNLGTIGQSPHFYLQKDDGTVLFMAPSQSILRKRESSGVVSMDSPRKKVHLTNLIVFYNEITIQIDERTAVDVIYLGISKAFDSLPQHPHN